VLFCLARAAGAMNRHRSWDSSGEWVAILAWFGFEKVLDVAELLGAG